MAKIRGGYAKKVDLDLSYSLYDFLRQVNILTILIESTEKVSAKDLPNWQNGVYVYSNRFGQNWSPVAQAGGTLEKRGPSDACWYTFLGNFPLITDYDLGRGRGSLFCLCKSTLFKGAKYPTVNPGSALWLYITSKVIQLSGSFCQKSIFDSQ